MRKQATPINLDQAEKDELESLLRSGKTEQRKVLRVKIVLAAAKGKGTNEIARELRVIPATVSKWRTRFARDRIPGLDDEHRSGAKPKYNEETEKRILRKLDEPPPDGYSSWNGTLLSAELKDVSPDQVWRVLRRYDIQLQRRKSWCISVDPEFASKAADIVGLYLNPPENAVVLSVDEKPGIQALERAQGYIKMPDGKAISGYSHEYTRHGTTTLLAALETATGQLKEAGHYNRRRRIEFLDFMNHLVKNYSPTQELHVILDNYRTHKPKHDLWLARHKNVHFHFTPTHASWLNQIECWFSILWRNALKGASFTSPNEVRLAIDLFIKAYNEKAHPFMWKKDKVYSVHPKKHYADLCK